MNDDKEPDVNEIEWVYCIVGNIIAEYEFGENKEIKCGTKHFRPGTKVFCLPHLGFGGVGWDAIVVMGKPRKQFKLIQIVMPRNRIINFRVKQVWNKRVIKAMGIFDQNSNETNKEKLLEFAEFFNKELADNK